MPYLMYLLVCFIWGSSFMLMKKAVLCFSPASVGAWRLAGGAAVLALLWRRDTSRRPLGKADLWPLAFVAVAGYTWPYAVQPFLVGVHGGAFIAMTVSFVPLLTIVASIPWLGVYPNRRAALGVVGGLVCMAALLADGLRRDVPLGHLCLAGTVPAGYAATNIMIRRRLSQVSPLSLSVASLTLASGLLLPLSLVLPGPLVRVNGDFPLALVSLVALGTVGTGLAVYLFNRLVQEHGPLFAGMVTYLIPVGALAWGWFDRERVTPLQLAALAGILLMVAVVQYGAAARPR